MSSSATHFDVLIVGAGLSGVAAGYYMQARCPNRSYAILEMRGAIGGTWDLFRYPGIRCDSDMFSLGFPFRPWPEDEMIAGGEAICDYIQDTAREFGIDRHIRFHHKVVEASWSSAEGRWTLVAEHTKTGERLRYTANFVISCSGYYDYENPYTPEFPGREDFQGELIHPQLWSDEVDYTGKQVVVIGSGATAVTMVPAMAERAAKVTMLQRSPSYYIGVPSRDQLAARIREHLPPRVAGELLRWKNTLTAMGVYKFCRAFPKQARALLEGQVARALGADFEVAGHFSPDYEPWDQRLCLVPDNDLFKALRAGKAEIVTDHIERFTASGIRLRSGRELEADLVVSATGLNIKMLGGVTARVDGEPVVPRELLVYRGCMFSGVPNFALAIGYTNLTWTLKIEITLEYVCRLLRHMDATGQQVAVPHLDEAGLETEPMISNLNSGYVERVRDELPRMASKLPWRMARNHLVDRLILRFSPLEDGVLELSSPSGDAGEVRGAKPASAVA